MVENRDMMLWINFYLFLVNIGNECGRELKRERGMRAKWWGFLQAFFLNFFLFFPTVIVDILIRSGNKMDTLNEVFCIWSWRTALFLNKGHVRHSLSVIVRYLGRFRLSRSLLKVRFTQYVSHQPLEAIALLDLLLLQTHHVNLQSDWKKRRRIHSIINVGKLVCRHK